MLSSALYELRGVNREQLRTMSLDKLTSLDVDRALFEGSVSLTWYRHDEKKEERGEAGIALMPYHYRTDLHLISDTVTILHVLRNPGSRLTAAATDCNAHAGVSHRTSVQPPAREP